MVTLIDRCYVVILTFYFILACLAPSGGQKMFSKVILIATEGSASVVLKISQAISSMIHHFNVILEWIKNF